MIRNKNLWSQFNDLVNNGVFILTKQGVPGATDGPPFAGKGSLCVDSTNGILYINTGTATTPTWTKVGLQS